MNVDNKDVAGVELSMVDKKVNLADKKVNLAVNSVNAVDMELSLADKEVLWLIKKCMMADLWGLSALEGEGIHRCQYPSAPYLNHKYCVILVEDVKEMYIYP